MVEWRRRQGKEERRALTDAFQLCVGDHSTAVREPPWLPGGGNVICVLQHTSTHNPLPLFTLDQLQSSSTPNYLGSYARCIRHMCALLLLLQGMHIIFNVYIFPVALIVAPSTLLSSQYYPIYSDMHLSLHVVLSRLRSK